MWEVHTNPVEAHFLVPKIYRGKQLSGPNNTFECHLQVAQVYNHIHFSDMDRLNILQKFEPFEYTNPVLLIKLLKYDKEIYVIDFHGYDRNGNIIPINHKDTVYADIVIVPPLKNGFLPMKHRQTITKKKGPS